MKRAGAYSTCAKWKIIFNFTFLLQVGVVPRTARIRLVLNDKQNCLDDDNNWH